MSRKQIAVEVCDIHKEFILPQHKNTTFKQTIVNFIKKNNKTTQKVLDGVSFNVNKGDFFGIVGRNGSGKSTLLKLIAGVYTPTSGYVNLNGGLTPFIELGVGFNPELSGRDNVYLNGALLGFNRKQVNEMYEEIVDFAELAPFMDQKLKNYSSGMQVRLAFSIAIKAKNEILIFDEVLAVGDEAFQRKCLDTFEGYKAEGQTVILVTHDMGTVKNFCNKAVLIDGGKIIEIGDPKTVADKYSELNQIAINKEIEHKNEVKLEVENIKVDILDESRVAKQSFLPNEKIVFKIIWDGLSSEKIESINLNIFKRTGEHVTGITTRSADLSDSWRDKGFIFVESCLNIKPGSYYVTVIIFKQEGVIECSMIDGPNFIVLDKNVNWAGLVKLPHKWIED